ncbi:hypothetical protein D3C87_2096580 [compost metagenome]
MLIAIQFQGACQVNRSDEDCYHERQGIRRHVAGANPEERDQAGNKYKKMKKSIHMVFGLTGTKGSQQPFHRL